MKELNIKLSEISLQDFYGYNNKNLKMLRTFFPDLKIIGRDRELVVKGDEENIKVFESKILNIISFLKQYNKLSDKDIEDIMLSDSFSLNGKEEVILHGIGGKPIIAKSANQKQIVQEIIDKDLVFVSGPAGTGKTYTCVALAVKALKNKEVRRIVLTRPAVEAGERIGFLPGDYKEKLDPYMQPLYDALKDMIHTDKLSSFLEKGVIEIIPLAFMRGRTLDHAFVILDEAQNTTILQMKMFLTRMGRNAKFMITGDPKQNDLDQKSKSGLAHALKILENEEGIGNIKLSSTKDMMRHKLVSKIIKAYEKE